MKPHFASALFAAVLSLSAQVRIINAPLPLSGDPDAAGWKNVPEQSDFKLLKSSGKTKPAVQTSFKVAADADN
ncbi:MAG: hypothetical protein IKO93_21155, partial [Lentisphaeria bacterium]|nr:hypothetical protein [Lentisphaeria bacterium]